MQPQHHHIFIMRYLLVGQGRYRVPICRTKKILITPPHQPASQFLHHHRVPRPRISLHRYLHGGCTIHLVAKLSIEPPTSCRRKKHRNPNCTMSLLKNTLPVHPPPLPPLAPPETNTNAGIHLASATSNSSGGLSGAHRFVDVASFLHAIVETTCNSSHINSNKYFFSSFNDANPLHAM